MDGPPPPPPPHGENPHTTEGEYRKSSDLPPGNYDIFVVPPHSSGSGFLYLPSLHTQRNSFLAGVGSTLLVVLVWAAIAPTVKTWYVATVSSNNNMGMVVVALGVGVAGWAFGMSQSSDGSKGNDGNGNGNGNGGRGGRFGGGFPGSGAGGSHSRGQSSGANYNNGSNFGGSGPGQQQYGGNGPGSQQHGGNFGGGGQYGNQYAGNQNQQQNQDNAEPPPKPEEKKKKQEPNNADWEREREETKRKEELRRKMEEFKRKREAEAKEKERKREREAMEKELRERREQLEREMAAARAAAEKETRERMEKEAAEARAKQEKAAAEAKAEADRLAREAKEKSDRLAAEAKERADKLAAEAKEKAEKEAAEKEAAAKAAAQKEAMAKFAALKEAAAKRYAEKKAQESKKEAEAAASKPASATGAPRTPSPKKPAYSNAAKTAVEDDAYSFRPYDRPRRPYGGASGSSAYSESSYAPSQSTARTTPPPSHRSSYSTKDPDKIVIQGVYAFNNAYMKTPIAQLVSGQGMVTDGLVLRITTEGLFVDDDLRGVGQREWDVKAWTLKLAEVWCPQLGATTAPQKSGSSNPFSFRRGGSAHSMPTSEESDALVVNLLKACKNTCRLASPSACFARSAAASGINSGGPVNAPHGEFRGLHILRASLRDQEGKRFVFVLQDTEAWKVAIGLQRLRAGALVRALGVSAMPVPECKSILGGLGYI